MGRAIGIDLGTTNTVVAVLHEGRPQVVEDDKGYRVLPSVVSLDDFGTATVGHAARNKILTDPDRTVYAFKRLMGRRFDSEQAAEARRRVGYDIEQADDGLCTLRLGQQLLSPVEVSALVLQTAKEMAERALGETVDEAVITVPAYFNHQQRTATFEAAKVAGLRCERLLNEPTAAALAYGFRRDSDRTIVIYDLGGGTFDVSVLHLSGGVYEILATKGDTYLGGEDFDYRLVDYLADHFQTQTGFDLRQDRAALQRIKDAAERAKCELSFTDRTTVLVPRLTSEHNLELAVTRLTLESLVEDLVERTLDVTRRALSDAGLQLNDIDDVILVGGQTRMPRVREAISGLFGRQPSRGVHPEEVVAIGAAVHAASLTDQDDAPQHVLIDVTPFDLGIDVIGGLFQPIIPRNTHVPTSETRAFATSQDDQRAVRVTVRQGDSRFADENEFLGEFIMSGLTPAPRMQTKVEVTFRIDSNGMLHASAVEPGTGESRRITIRNYGEVAQSKGAVKPRIDSDGKPDVIEEPGESAVARVGAPADQGDAGGRSRRGGFLAGLFGRRRGSAPKQPAGSGPDAVEQAGAVAAAGDDAVAAAGDDAVGGTAAAQDAEAGPTAPSPGINLPEVEPLEAIDDAAVEEVLPPANIEDDDLLRLGDDVLEPVDSLRRPAAVGMAGAARDAWDDDRDDSFQMPAFEDEEDDDELPLGLAGGGFEESVDEMFALPESSDDGMEELDDGLLELGDEPVEEADDLGELFAPTEEAPQHEDLGVVEAPTLEEDPFGLAGDGLFALDDVHADDAAGTAGADTGERADGGGGVPSSPPDAGSEGGADDDGSDFGDLFASPEASADAPGEDAGPGSAGDDDPFADLAGDIFGDLDEDPALSATDPAQPNPPADAVTGPASGATADEPDTGDLFAFTAPADGKEEEAAFMLPPPDTAETSPQDEADEVFGLPGTVEDPAEVFGLPGVVEGEDAASTTGEGDAAVGDLFAGAPALPPRHSEHDDERTEIFARSPGPAARGGETRRKKRRRKPARLKLAYRQVEAMVTEHRENLRRGGCFVKTNKPLPVGRECVIEVRAPGMDHPLALQGVVTWSSVGLSTLPEGQDPGMGIEYRLDDERRLELEQVLASLGA